MISSDDLLEKNKTASLKDLSPMILLFLRQKINVSFQDVIDHIYQNSSSNKNSDRTIRRRVYDVLNVLLAAEIISKTGKILHYLPGLGKEPIKTENKPNLSVNPPILSVQSISPARPLSKNPLENEINLRISQKTAILVEKIHLYLYNLLLLKRNTNKQRPFYATPLPAIIVGLTSSEGTWTSRLDGTVIDILSPTTFSFFSPKDIFDLIDFSSDEKYAIFQQIPYIHSMEPILFPNQKSDNAD